MAFIPSQALPRVGGREQLARTAWRDASAARRLTCRGPRRAVVTSRIEEEVRQKLTEAMRARAADDLRALRAIRAAFLNVVKSGETAVSGEVSDGEAQTALRKLAKMRNESIDMFVQAGRDDLADLERAELAIIQQWLPTLAGEEQTSAWVREAVETVGASKPGDVGKVMG